MLTNVEERADVLGGAGARWVLVVLTLAGCAASSPAPEAIPLPGPGRGAAAAERRRATARRRHVRCAVRRGLVALMAFGAWIVGLLGFGAGSRLPWKASRGVVAMACAATLLRRIVA